MCKKEIGWLLKRLHVYCVMTLGFLSPTSYSTFHLFPSHSLIPYFPTTLPIISFTFPCLILV
ncbi:hypothetical protein BCR42DRAFT_427491 [Absidia repens]|uniref:Uncharacterized protein n=1 Tax=Absidia repens TaxID=90262 RepID=A0A1X2HZC1_9FUNG|nr:hypothetical protein BCR42DRAFT_427491 [Absidia repens]